MFGPIIMGGKKRKLQHAPRPGQPKPKGKPAGSSNNPPPKKTAASPAKQTGPRREEAPTIPFGRHERILLIGEGDLSFAASLVRHHRCTNVTATVLEKDPAELAEKYPEHHAAEVLETIGDIEDAADDDIDEDDFDEDGELRERNNRVVYNIDATKPLPATLTRPPPDRILFNFPHVGGRSTDVNRQVRYNQELLVSFFQRAALPALAPGGSIVVTLFEGEPYTLWNVRDLARHAGLQVERSFRFHAEAYPGYRHARTLGVVTSRKGETGGGWKGEERAARSYIFVRKGDVPQPVTKKRRRGDDESSDED